jgi:hypothetical protein
MEHAWGVRMLHQLVPDAVFRGLRLQEMFAAGQALAAYMVEGGIRRLRTEFLRRWLAP